MPENLPLIFSNVTPQQFDALAAKARANGIALSGNSGTANKFGVEVSWNYEAATEQLTLQCLSTPFFITPEQVNAQLRQMVESVTA